MTASVPPQDPHPNLPARRSSAELPAPILPNYGPAAYPQEEESGAPDFRRLLAAVYRHKWLVILGVGLGVGAGVGATHVVKPVFETKGTIWIQAGDSRDRTGPIQSAQLLEQYAWLDLLKSYAVLDEAVRRRHLFVQPKLPGDSGILRGLGLSDRVAAGAYTLTISAAGDSFALARDDGRGLQRGAVGDSIGSPAGFMWAPARADLSPGRAVKFMVSNPRDAARALAQSLRADIDPQGNFLQIGLAGEDPQEITETVNAVLDRFVEVAAELKRERLTELTRILQGQLDYAAQNLHNSEIALENFRVQTITLPTDRTPVTPGLQETRDPVFTNFFNMNIEKEQVRVDREALERALAQARDSGGLSTDAFATIGAVQRSPEMSVALKELTDKQAELRALRLRYTEDAPPVRRAAEGVDSLTSRTIPRLGTQLLGQLRAREAALSERVSTTSGELQRIPPRAIEEARLERQVGIAASLYTNLQQRYEEARLAEASAIPDVRILDRAGVPESPLKNTAIRMLLMGLVGGIGLGIGAALLLDRLDKRVRYPDQITRDMGLSILGAVPHVNMANGSAKEDAAQVLEAVRGLRLSLVHAYGSAGPLFVTVTSPGAGDGKSFITSNLALSFADNGHRTLLLDCDVRRGRQHELFKLGRKPGITDFLSGHATLEQVIRQTSYAGLSVVPSGTRTSGAPELLNSPAMQQLLVAVRSSFDAILVDSPPLGAGVDPFLLGTLTGNIMLVLRTGLSDRSLAEAKLDMLQRLPVRVLGAVLNDVRPNDTYGYYHQYYAYLPGYEAKDEGESAGITRPSQALPGAAKR
ncbi:MAG TPA: polysaccharide biosynthesis tyrosine autokinase [Gemmatimonadales bacterium]|nr:polysaccharide biosynthesis tyrosine autokinase [Gemmatimonadales bacterium]